LFDNLQHLQNPFLPTRVNYSPVGLFRQNVSFLPINNQHLATTLLLLSKKIGPRMKTHKKICVNGCGRNVLPKRMAKPAIPVGRVGRREFGHSTQLAHIHN
jgi:hypothetical protein